MSRKYVKFIMESFSHYEFCGKNYGWPFPPIVVMVSYNKNTDKMYHAAHNKIAKEIVARKSCYSKNEYKYFNKIDFHIIEDKPVEKILRNKTKPKMEYIDLFGQTKEILSNGKERIKPVPKGE